RQRDCLALRYYLELPIDQIATTLDISANSVKTHLKRGLRSMAASLDSTREEQ
ncbi:MAG: sigma factor-like helix-turn-helix DNA-binding protein, partial [Jiangellaceae bacterium]